MSAKAKSPAPVVVPRAKAARLLAISYVALSFYVLGCLGVENDVNYPAWREVGAAEFPAFHRALEANLRFVMFTPMVVHLIVGVALLALRNPALPRPLVALAVALDVYIVVESVAVQVPLHKALEASMSAELLERLIFTHRVFRLPAQITSFVVTCALLARLVPAATPR